MGIAAGGAGCLPEMSELCLEQALSAGLSPREECLAAGRVSIVKAIAVVAIFTCTRCKKEARLSLDTPTHPWPTAYQVESQLPPGWHSFVLGYEHLCDSCSALVAQVLDGTTP